jgi:two-component system response regulator RegA
MQPSILLVDDDRVFLDRMARAFRERGYEVRTASDVDGALDAVGTDSPELAVVDLRMPGRSGLDLVRELKALDAATKIVVLTGYGSIPTAVQAMQLGAASYLSKPADVDDVLLALKRAGGDEPAAPAASDLAVVSLARAEWEHIQRVLGDCGGNVSEAARRLGIHRRSLQRKLQKHPPRA